MLFLTVPKRKDHIPPWVATGRPQQGLSGGVGGAAGPEPLLWFAQERERPDKQAWKALGHRLCLSLSGTWPWGYWDRWIVTQNVRTPEGTWVRARDWLDCVWKTHSGWVGSFLLELADPGKGSPSLQGQQGPRCQNTENKKGMVNTDILIFKCSDFFCEIPSKWFAHEHPFAPLVSLRCWGFFCWFMVVWLCFCFWRGFFLICKSSLWFWIRSVFGLIFYKYLLFCRFSFTCLLCLLLKKGS